MSYFLGLRTSGSALTAQRLRMDVIAHNIANLQTTRTPQGGPYRRRQVVFTPLPVMPPLGGVQVLAIVEDATPFQRVHDPGHPDADADGFVAYPNVDIVTEMVDMISATRAYEANVTVMKALKSMALKALEIGRA